MKIYKNPFVSRLCYFVNTGKAFSYTGEPSKSKGYQVQFLDGKWEVKEVCYYDFSLRDDMPVIAENNTSIQSIIEKAVLNAVLDLVGANKLDRPTEKGDEGE